MVDPADGGWVTVDDRERWDVLNDLGDSSGNGMRSYLAELMDGGEAGNDSIVRDVNMASEGSVVGKDDIISDLAIVCDVSVGEAKII